MTPSTAPGAFHGQRLLVVDRDSGMRRDTTIEDLPCYLRSGDVLVINDAATLPASLRISAELEVRLVSHHDDRSWWGVAFGAGDYAIPTELRPPPPTLAVGDAIKLPGLSATVAALSPWSLRLLLLRFAETGPVLWQKLYELGRPIQYAYVRSPLELWDVQTSYAGRPVAMEMPSAGRPLTFAILQRLKSRGIEIVPLTHAAGVSSTGVTAIDERLPLPERYWLSGSAVNALTRAFRAPRRIIAVGTSVVRALEDNFGRHGRLIEGSFEAHGRLGPASTLRVVDGLLTGMHEPGTSHFDLLQAFVPASLLQSSVQHATERGYLTHEFGDSALLLRDSLAALAFDCAS